jgi:hypothetical protein
VNVNKETERHVQELVQKIPALTEGQLYWLKRVIQIFECPHDFRSINSSLFDDKIVQNFGDALRIHHSFSSDAFSKDKFEYVLEKVMNMSGHLAVMAPRGNRGHDIMIDGIKVSLKTQANASIQLDRIWISKFMELGRGQWGDNPKDLVRLRNMFLDHLQGYDRIFTLRALHRAPEWAYELVEIPKTLLLSSKNGELRMQIASTQFPKPGYCTVRVRGEEAYQLYFDGGTERKLQIKNLAKSRCIVHATWNFTVPPESVLLE